MTADHTPALPDDGADSPDRALAARFRAAAPVLDADPAAIVARGRRRRRATRAATAALSVVAVAAVATGAVGLLRGSVPPPADTPPPPEAPSPVSLWLSAEQVPPGDAEMVAVLVSNDGTEATFGVPAALERWDGSAWRAFRRTNMCLADWHCTARWYPPDAPEVQGAEDIGLGVAAGSPGPVERFTVDGLDPGWYRVVQEAYGGVVARGVFEVAADAPAATPLWPTDAPAVSVQPGLLATTGGAVTLVPLVAPVDGNLDAGMLEAAMTGLGPLALVQRWDGSGWTEAGDVETTAADEVSVPGELRATLPALEPGAYRVLLRGNGKELMGSFWVRGDAEDGDAAPPPEEPGPVSLWLSADRVPPGDTELVAILVSNDGTEATFGVYAELERWDGDSWVLERHSGLCLAEWHCTARMQPLADDLAIEDIGLWVDATTPGPVERFTVEGLDPGWYRLSTETNDGDVARGVFELADDAPEPAPLWPVDDVAVTVQPPLVQPYTADQEVAVSPWYRRWTGRSTPGRSRPRWRASSRWRAWNGGTARAGSRRTRPPSPPRRTPRYRARRARRCPTSNRARTGSCGPRSTGCATTVPPTGRSSATSGSRARHPPGARWWWPTSIHASPCRSAPRPPGVGP